MSVAVEGTHFSVWKGLGDKLEINVKKEKVIRSSKYIVRIRRWRDRKYTSPKTYNAG